MLIGTCLPQFMYKLQGSNGRTCITLFSLDLNCMHSPHRSLSGFFRKACKARTNYFQAGEAFAIISIFVYFAAFIAGVLQFFRKISITHIIAGVNAAGVITALIVWLVMIHVYNSNDLKQSNTLLHECQPLKDSNYNLGAGFALIILAWVLNLIAIPFLYIPL